MSRSRATPALFGVLLDEPFLMSAEVTGVAKHHHRFAAPEDRAGAGQRQLTGNVPATTLAPRSPGPRVQRPPDRYGLDVANRQLAGDRQCSVQQRHVPQDLVEYAGGPAAVGDV